MTRHLAPSDQWLLRLLLLSVVAAVFVVGRRRGGDRRRLDGYGKDGRQRRGGDIERRREGFAAGVAEEKQLQSVRIMDGNAATFRDFRRELFVRSRF